MAEELQGTTLPLDSCLLVEQTGIQVHQLRQVPQVPQALHKLAGIFAGRSGSAAAAGTEVDTEGGTAGCCMGLKVIFKTL